MSIELLVQISPSQSRHKTTDTGITGCYFDQERSAMGRRKIGFDHLLLVY